MNHSETSETDSEHPEWRVPVTRIAPLVDGEEYYPALRQALIQARQSIFIIGWDLHSEIELLRGEAATETHKDDTWPVRLADLLLALLEARDSLHIRLLIWEGSTLFVFERQHIPRMKWPWAKHPRMELVWDRDTPRLSSHHQKLVVIDDQLAFAGGMDLTAGRWDSHEHARQDTRRQMPGLFARESQPYHDAMFVFDGEGARVLGEWARERWRRATDQVLMHRDPTPDDPDPWPACVEPVFREQVVEIALTQPLYGGRPEKGQVESSYIKQIEKARKIIYIESQYLTCAPIVDALCEQLRTKDGPEVIIILPYGCPGTLQAMSMDPQRDKLLDKLRSADEGGRFGAYWVTLRGPHPECPLENAVYIHAKTMVVDQHLLRIGSANLNNRSMGLDTELDVSLIIAEGDTSGEVEVTRYRRRLIAYLLGVSPEELARAEEERGSVLSAIESLRGGEHTLHPFDHRAGTLESSFALSPELSDPRRPLTDIDADRVLEVVQTYTRRGATLRRRMAISIGLLKRRRHSIAAIVLLVSAVLLLLFSPMNTWLDQETLRTQLVVLRSSPLGIVGVFIAFALLATCGFPMTVLLAATGVVYTPMIAIPLSLVGASTSAYLSFVIGEFAPPFLREFVLQRTPTKVVERLSNMSVLGVVVLRHIPVAPFAVVNIACGVVGVPRGRFLVGNAIGMLPPVLVLAFFGQEATRLLSDPSPGAIARLALLAVAVIILALMADRCMRMLEAWRGKSTPPKGS